MKGSASRKAGRNRQTAREGQKLYGSIRGRNNRRAKSPAAVAPSIFWVRFFKEISRAARRDARRRKWHFRFSSLPFTVAELEQRPAAVSRRLDSWQLPIPFFDHAR